MSQGDYVLQNVTRQTYIINEYEPANRGVKSLLHQMITYGLKSFIDTHYSVEGGKVRVMASAAEFDESAGALVKNAIWIHDMPFSEEFGGFSPEVIRQAEELQDLSGMKVLMSQDEQFDRKTGAIGLYAFQESVFKLKQSAINEALEFVNFYFRLPSESDGDLRYEVLAPEDFELGEMEPEGGGLQGMNLDPDLIFSTNKPSKKRRSRRNEFSEQVVELLQENNRILAQYSNRFEDLQKQIDEIRSDNNQDIREEISEMRGMIRDLSERQANRPETIEDEYFVFEKNEFSLTEVQKARLNATVVRLAKNPELRVLITGYADKSGNSEWNAIISRKRAESVRNHLIRMGIEESRMILTYLGDTESTSVGAADRRVEVSLFVP